VLELYETATRVSISRTVADTRAPSTSGAGSADVLSKLRFQLAESLVGRNGVAQTIEYFQKMRQANSDDEIVRNMAIDIALAVVREATSGNPGTSDWQKEVATVLALDIGDAVRIGLLQELLSSGHFKRGLTDADLLDMHETMVRHRLVQQEQNLLSTAMKTLLEDLAKRRIIEPAIARYDQYRKKGDVTGVYILRAILIRRGLKVDRARVGALTKWLEGRGQRTGFEPDMRGSSRE
jgi:hypothetical protein